MQSRIVNFITAHSNISEEKFRSLMSRTDVLVNDIGSLLNGYEAVECGIIDEMGGINEALSYLKAECKFKKGNG
jgi:ATP-dependent protease ClpP protease subunit